MLFSESKKKNDSCPIFHIPFNDDDKIIELPCEHCFTPDAIKRWLKEESNLCPVCRHPLKEKEVLKDKYKKKEEEEQQETEPPTFGPITLEEYEQQQEQQRNRRPFMRANVNQLIERMIQREEEAELQAALLASLNDNF